MTAAEAWFVVEFGCEAHCRVERRWWRWLGRGTTRAAVPVRRCSAAGTGGPSPCSRAEMNPAPTMRCGVSLCPGEQCHHASTRCVRSSGPGIKPDGSRSGGEPSDPGGSGQGARNVAQRPETAGGVHHS
jgi:hypothetical protein